MVNAGAATDAVIDEFAPLLEDGDMIIDGGNAHFKDTRRREAKLEEQGLHFVGMGVSGGEEGALNGPSIMPGGSTRSPTSPSARCWRRSARTSTAPRAARTSARTAPATSSRWCTTASSTPTCSSSPRPTTCSGTASASSPRRSPRPSGRWNTGRLDSYLIEITAEVLAHTDASTGKPFVDIVLDQAEQKGTGRWTVQDALDLGVPVSGIAEAVFARSLSGHADLRQAARGAARPDAPRPAEAAEFADQIEQALYASKLVSYAQGWNMMDVGSREYDWDLDLGQIAVIWRGGCIIRAAFLDRIRAAYENNAELPTLLVDEEFGKELAAAQDAWRNVVATAVRLGIPVPGFSAALAYYDALRAERLPAALIQGLRDFFGAHTYRRTDRDGTFHTLWAQDRSEETH